MESRRIFSILLLAVLLLPSGCASRLPVLDYDSLDEPVSPEVIELWESRREVVVRAIKEKKFTIREFQEALRFFEKMTGLPARQASTRYGRMPNDLLTEDLRSWDDWFRANGAGLRVEDMHSSG